MQRIDSKNPLNVNKAGVVLTALLACACAGEANTDRDPTDGGFDAAAPADGSRPVPDGRTPPVDSGATVLPEQCGDAALTQWEQMMLDAHNEWRSSVDPPAADMYRVHWDSSIAQNAVNWVSSCDPDWPHSPEELRTGVGGYDVLGENLSYCAGSGCADDPSVTDGSGKGDGQGWWEERADYRWADDTSSGVTSHYTQMTSSNVYAVGCATQECGAPGPFGWDGTWWWTICQYGPRGAAYWVGNKPYERGSGGLVEPPASVYELHPALCEAVSD